MRRLFGKCNLCGWPIARLDSSVFGTRCVRCASTQVHRAVGSVIQSLDLDGDSEVYELSSRGALFKYLKKRFRNFYFSDYFDDVPPGGSKNGIPCQDVQSLRLGDRTFDLVTSTEVFEHVPDDRAGFSQIFGILNPDGHFLFTVPLTTRETTFERASVKPDGTVELHAEPEYHSDRIRGDNKVFVFRNYGMDILDRLGSAGFEAEVRTVTSGENRIRDIRVIVAAKRRGS